MPHWLSKLKIRDEEGAEVFEAALVVPLLLTLLLGVISVGRAYNVYESMTRAAREGARALVLTSCATCGNAPYTASAVRTTFVEPALAAASLDPTAVMNYSSNYVWLDPEASPPQQCGVAISFNYPYQLVVPFTSVNLTTVTLSTRVQMRLENQPATCSAGSAVP
jgi:Flp pilus assembly protein TadG